MVRRASIPSISDYAGSPRESNPRISVVTAVRNGGKTLARAVASVRAQTLDGLEYIIVDGGSSDDTMDIVRANLDVVSFWKSEPDLGISDGFNKAIALSQGTYVAILNADDWLSPGQLGLAIETLERTGADFVFGDLLYHDADGAPLHRMRGETGYARRIHHVMPALNHPTVVVRRDVYVHFGLFDLGLQYAMDYELLHRLHRGGCQGVYDPRILGHMSLEGASDTHSRRALAEVRDIAIRHGGWPPREWSRFLFRVFKGEARRAIEALLPPKWAHRLRRKANRNYVRLAP